MVDEMDLLSDLKTAEPMRPRAFEEARALLLAELAIEEGAPGTKTAARRRARWGTRRTVGVSAAGLVAAAAAVALVVTSAPAPSHHAAATGRPSSPAKPGAANPVAGNPILTQLAANISVQQVKLPGNATLEIRNQSPTRSRVGDNGVDLYTDNGTYYSAGSKSALPQVIARGQDMGEGEFKRAISAALLAVNGNLATARATMAVANFLPGTHPGKAGAPTQAEIEKIKAVDKAQHIRYTPPKPLTPAQLKEQTDNFIWMNSNFALIAAPDNAQVRAGVLRIMATMPNVKVTHTTTAGQATLTLSDSWPNLAGGDTESLVINASTGLPVAGFDSGPNQPSASTYYHTSRVTLADVEAGKF
jgi:hypothetical protein